MSFVPTPDPVNQQPHQEITLDQPLADLQSRVNELRAAHKTDEALALLSRVRDLLCSVAHTISSGPLPESEPVQVTSARHRVPTSETVTLEDFVSQSPGMLSALRAARAAVHTTLPTVIVGETGVGKTWLARAIHNSHPKSAPSPYYSLNIGTLHETLIDAQLFGHERGAFTGAEKRAHGAFHRANGGTLFLDDFSDLPLAQQAKLLDVLESGLYRPLGSADAMESKFKLIVGTRFPLDQLVAEKTLREDLRYRLAGLEVHVPPLRERREDIPGLVANCLRGIATENSMRGLRLEDAAVERITAHHWPGNLRELQAVLKVAAALCPQRKITRPYILFSGEQLGELPEQRTHSGEVGSGRELEVEEFLGDEAGAQQNGHGVDDHAEALAEQSEEPLRANGEKGEQNRLEVPVSPQAALAELRDERAAVEPAGGAAAPPPAPSPSEEAGVRAADAEASVRRAAEVQPSPESSVSAQAPAPEAPRKLGVEGFVRLICEACEAHREKGEPLQSIEAYAESMEVPPNLAAAYFNLHVPSYEQRYFRDHAYPEGETSRHRFIRAILEAYREFKDSGKGLLPVENYAKQFGLTAITASLFINTALPAEIGEKLADYYRRSGSRVFKSGRAGPH